MSIPRLRANDQIADANGVVTYLFQRWLDRLCGRIDNNARAITASGAVQGTDYLILANATGGAITVTLPPVAASRGRELVVKKTDASANAVTVDGNSSETVDGGANISTTTQNVAMRVLCDGTQWWRV